MQFRIGAQWHNKKCVFRYLLFTVHNNDTAIFEFSPITHHVKQTSYFDYFEKWVEKDEGLCSLSLVHTNVDFISGVLLFTFYSSNVDALLTCLPLAWKNVFSSGNFLETDICHFSLRYSCTVTRFSVPKLA